MAMKLCPILQEAQFDSNGNLAAGWKIWTERYPDWAPVTTYTTKAGDVAHTNPIILNARGELDDPIWLESGSSYNFELFDANDVLVNQFVNIDGVNDTTTSQEEWVLSALSTTYISATSFSVVGDQTLTFEVGRRVKTVNTGGTVYGFIVSSTFAGGVTTIVIAPDSNGLDAGLSSVSYGVLSATNHTIPSVLNLRRTINQITNGQFRIAQAGASFAAPASGAYDLDGWLNANTGAGVFTIAQSAGSSTGKFCRTMTVTTADAAVAAGDVVVQQTFIEGYDAVKLLGNTFTLRFKVKSSVTGIHCVSFYDSVTPASYIMTYTINTANTWEEKSLTLIGGLQSLSSNTNAPGVAVRWCNAAGATYQDTANTWHAANVAATSGQVNDLATNGNVFALQDVTLNLGTVATTDDMSLAEEIIRCQRYYQSLRVDIFGYGAAGQSAGYGLNWPVIMRAAPTTAFSGGAYVNASGIAIANTSSKSGRVSCSVTGTNSFQASDWTLTLAARL